MGRSARWGMVTAALVFTASMPARADDDKANREAEARFKEGLTRVKNKDYDAARLSFAQAYAVLHRPLILWNLALAEEKCNRPLEALGHFRQVAREAPGDADRGNAQKHVDTLLGQVARIDVQAPAGTVLALDGAEGAGTAPLGDPLDVMPGHHVIAAKMAAGATKTSDVDAVAGQVAHVSFVADAPTPAAIVVALPSTAPAAAPSSATAQTEALPASVPADVPPRSFWTPRTISVTALGGVAVVAAGFGAFFAIKSQNAKSTVTGYQNRHKALSFCTVMPGVAAPSDCGPWNDAVNTQNRNADISDALYFAAGALAVGAVVSWFFWPKAGPAKAAWVVPEVGPGNAGVEAGGRF
jgi:hypothetical protein